MPSHLPDSVGKNLSLRSALTFLIVGGFATGLQFVIMALLIWSADVPAVWASGIGFSISAVCNYLLNARLTFRSNQSHTSTAPRFVVTALAGLLINSLALTGLKSLGLHIALAQLITTICVFIWNYFVNAIWTFKPQVP